MRKTKVEPSEVEAILRKPEKDQRSLASLAKYSAFPPEIYGLLLRTVGRTKGKKNGRV